MDPTEYRVAQIRAGVTNEEVARSLGINVSTVYRKINGESDFTLSELRELKKIFGLSKDDVDRIFFSEELAETQEKLERSIK